MKKILILSNESGGGHKQTARVLSQFLQKEEYVIKTVSVFKELFIDLDYGAIFFNISGEDIYNKLLLQQEAPHLFYKFFFFSVYYSFVVSNRKRIINRFKTFFEQEQPDLIISVIPVLNREITTAINPNTPFLIIQTDLFEYEEQSWFWRKLVPCGAWFVKDTHAYQLSGTDKGYQQALAYNADKNKVRQITGTVIDPRFLQTNTLNVAVERHKLGFKLDKLVGLFLYGGHPPERVFKLAKQLDKLNVTAQFIFICGRNESLKKRLEKLPTCYEKVVLGYSKEVPYYMQIADFLVGKPGPGTIMEGIALGLPVLLDTSHVMPHEEDNALWVAQHNWGLPFNTAQQLQACIQNFNESDSRPTNNRTRFDNRAVYEVAGLVEQILLDKP